MYTVTEAQISEALHIALILVLAINAYINFKIHGITQDTNQKITEANGKLNLVVQPKEHV